MPTTVQFDSHEAVMRHALSLARLGEGKVEPNPMVGAVVVNDALQVLGDGYHRTFGGAHAEVNALATAGDSVRGATLFVTLEPCCHFGQTPPCSRAVIDSGIQRVFVGVLDPSSKVAGRGVAELREAGIDVEVGLCGKEATELIAPFTTLNIRNRPFVIGKWAMTLDGKLASRSGHSQWISGEASRKVVHELRGRVDGILVGIGTALADDPALTARPAGPRTATRVVLDSHGRLPLDSQLARTAREVPVLVVVSDTAPQDRCAAFIAAGLEVMRLPTSGGRIDLPGLLSRLAERRMTNLLVEGGGGVLGDFFDLNLIDEAHVFVAPKVVGGIDAPSPVGGMGRATITEASRMSEPEITFLDEDVYWRGRFHSESAVGCSSLGVD